MIDEIQHGLAKGEMGDSRDKKEREGIRYSSLAVTKFSQK
jgi:hypothetical protein